MLDLEQDHDRRGLTSTGQPDLHDWVRCRLPAVSLEATYLGVLQFVMVYERKTKLELYVDDEIRFTKKKRRGLGMVSLRTTTERL